MGWVLPHRQQVGREGRARALGAAAEQAEAHSHMVTWLSGLRRAQVYRPLEFLFAVAAFTTLAENFLPQLIALPKARSPLCLLSVAGAVRCKNMLLLARNAAPCRNRCCLQRADCAVHQTLRVLRAAARRRWCRTWCARRCR